MHKVSRYYVNNHKRNAD